MIVVTGVHRSGTSAVAMTLRALGIDFGPEDKLYPTDRWNERGYVERTDVIDLNSRILTGFPRTRDPLSSLASQVQYIRLPSRRAIARRGRALWPEIAQLAADLDGVAVKDPRFCVTAQAWQEFVDLWVICLRDPLAVAESLRRRQRIPLWLGLRFWDRHAEQLLDMPEEETVFVDFDILCGEDRAVELSRLLGFLGIDKPLSGAMAVLEEELAPNLRHFTGENSKDLPKRTLKLWGQLQERRGC